MLEIKYANALNWTYEHKKYVRKWNIANFRCNSQCEGGICNETCTKLCEIAFSYPDQAEFDQEIEKYLREIAKLNEKFKEAIAKELKIYNW